MPWIGCDADCVSALTLFRSFSRPISMTLSRSFSEISLPRGCALSIGNFDGVHLGHQHIIEQLTSRAAALNVPSMVLTFDPHPIELLRPDHVPPRLTHLQQKANLLHGLGVDHVFAYSTDAALLELSPQEFFDEFVRQQLDARSMVEGPNFFFGKNRSGTVETLREFCLQAKIEFETVEPTTREENMVSSSAIRRALQFGEITSANGQLGRCYSITGTVVDGAKRGRTLGFPTANLSMIPTLIPKNGVYAGRCKTDSVTKAAAIHIGPNPTFEADDDQKVEVHLLDFNGDLYGQSLQVEFVARVRDVMAFDGPDELLAQLKDDMRSVQEQVPIPCREPK